MTWEEKRRLEEEAYWNKFSSAAKDKIAKLWEDYSSLCVFEEPPNEYLIDKESFKEAMIEFAREMCELQKKECADNGKLILTYNTDKESNVIDGDVEFEEFDEYAEPYYVTVDIHKKSILNCKNVCSNE